MMKWTEEQMQAINQEGTNIIVSAGAGSGKTAVLSERVLRKVKEGVDIRNILILTFTNEAAGEMKNRIRKKLEKEGLIEQLEYIDAAYIMTFDAYALQMVKKYHYLLDISKNVSIIDSSIIELEKERIIDEIFLELYEKKDANFLKLVGDFTNRDDNTIKSAILSINSSLDLKYDKISYLEGYLEDFYNEDNINGLFQEYFLYLKDLASLIEDAVYALEGLVDDKLYSKVYEAYSGVFKPKSYQDLFKIKMFPTIQFRNVEPEAKEIKENLKENGGLLLELTKYSEEELKKQIFSTKEYVVAIIKIILELERRIGKYKKEKEAFEFLDIAHMAIKIVRDNKEIREELKNTFNEILIDEYQDTNDLQEMFISKLENNNVYMVGDIKQSIYRFRNANPKIFKDKYDNYEKHIGGEKIDLLKNFRSRKEVLNNINEIFNLIMSEDIGGVNYKNNHAMVYGNLVYVNEGNNGYDNNLEILKYDEDTNYTKVEIEAFSIAQDIKEKMSSKYQVFDFDLGKNRDVKYSDFCIILDRGSDMPKYKKIFEFLNIPMDVYKDSDLISEVDIKVIKNIISLILLIKAKDYGVNMRYAFVSVGRSFVGNLSDAEIFTYIDDNTFYDSVVYKKCLELAKDIDNKTPKMLLEEIMDVFEFTKNYIKLGDIEASFMKMDYLLDLSSSMEDLGFSIEDFRDYLDNMLNSGKEIRYKESKTTSSCVKIMNIHKSKGLEFPICYFAGFKKNFNVQDLNSRFMYDNKYGILTPFYDEGIGTLFIKTLIKNRYYQEEISEKIRLFYVALTRAKEKMIMVMPNFEKEGFISNQVAKLEGLKYRSFYDFMSSIAINLKGYIKTINLDEIGLTKDYEFVRGASVNNIEGNKKMMFLKNDIQSKKISNKHASKIINNILTKKEQETLDFGTMMHEMLEMTNFKDKSISNKYIDNLRSTFDFENAKIYQELEFYFQDKDTEYHGIIDLMLEYEDSIKIIDYKLKNIDDENYNKQLNVYYNYIKNISNKSVELYLYSIIDNKIRVVDLGALKEE